MRGRIFLLEGAPGTGKTTIATQFLMEGAAQGERCLYVTLSETESELRAGAAAHGWNLAGLDVHELAPPESVLDEEQQQTLLYSSDLELGETIRQLISAFESVEPQRVVIDSLSEIRLLAQSSLRYRRQILTLKHYFAKRNATVLLLDDLTTDTNDKTVHSIAHGVIRLEQIVPDYGAERRRLRVMKYRGRRYRGGHHDFTIVDGGLRVFPRLVSAEHRRDFARDQLSSGFPSLDALLGGGLERGTNCLILGPAGTGKSLLTLLFVASATARGDKAVLFIFDEEMGLLFDRASSIGVDLAAMVAKDQLKVEQVDAAELTPGEFSDRVRNAVEGARVGAVVIDSLNGYQSAMTGENALILHMHELLQFLNRRGVTSFLTIAQHGLVGDMSTPVEVTYLADTVILLRYFEARGRVRRAISVIKKRAGAHEDTIREYRIGRDGFTFGKPLVEFQGILRGVPILDGDGEALLRDVDS